MKGEMCRREARPLRRSPSATTGTHLLVKDHSVAADQAHTDLLLFLLLLIGGAISRVRVRQTSWRSICGGQAGERGVGVVVKKKE